MVISLTTDFNNALTRRNSPKPVALVTADINNGDDDVTPTAFGIPPFGIGFFAGDPNATTNQYNLTDYLLSMPNISTSIEIETRGQVGRSSDISLTFDNTDKYFTDLDSGSFLYGKPYLNSQFYFDFGFDGVTEYIRQYTGQINKLKLSREKANVYLVDKFKDFLDKKMPTKEDSGDTTTGTYLVEWTNATPSEILWDILTDNNYGAGLDSTESSANVDIDWERFQESASNTNSIILSGGFYDNEEIGEALEEILKVSFGNMYISSYTGKVMWYTWLPEWIATDLDDLDDSDVKGIWNLQNVSVERGLKDVVNNVIIKYEYDKATDNYDSAYVLSDSDSISHYGTQSYVIESKFLQASNDVTDLADKLIKRYSTPILYADCSTDLLPVKLELNDFVKITDESTGLVEKRFQIISINKNLNSGTATLKTYDASFFDLAEGQNWSFIWDTNTDGNGSTNDGSIAYTSTDYDNDNFNARAFCWASGDIEAENFGYVCF